MEFSEIAKRKHGFLVHHHIELPHNFGQLGNGVYANDTIEKNSLLISIPRDKLFTTCTVLSNQRLYRIIEYSHDSTRNLHATPLTAMEVLVLGLLDFKYNPDSDFWNAYIKTIPTSYDTLIYWNDDELAKLGDTRLIEATKRRKAKISRLYSNLWTVIDNFHKIDSNTYLEDLSKYAYSKWMTLDNFSWAYSSIMSRSVYVKDACLWAARSSHPLKLYKDIAALPPLLDYFNHSNSTECTAGYNSRTQTYELFTNQEWPANTQVFIKYGQHSNDTLLKHYGFSILHNEHERISLDLKFEDLLRSQESDWKRRKLIEYNLIDESPSIKPNKSAVKHYINAFGFGWNTIVALKTLLMKEEEIAVWDNLLEDLPVSTANEEAYRNYCIDIIRKELSRLQDGASIPSNNASPDSTLSVRDLLAAHFRNTRIELLTQVENIYYKS